MKQKTKLQNKIFLVRLALTMILLAVFLPLFFVLGGSNLLLGKIGSVKHFDGLGFEVHYIDVGQGDSTFIRFPDNSNLLIDAGPPKSSSNLVEYLRDLFRQEGISKIDRFLLTHQDSDHVGGASAIFDAFQVGCVFRPKVYCQYEMQNLTDLQDYLDVTSQTYNRCIISAYNEPNCEMIFSSNEVQWAGQNYSVKFLSPNKDKYPSNNYNAYSPIVKVCFEERSFLFTGDAEKIAEAEVIENCPEMLDADVLKVGHHGSATSTSEKFLSYVTPKLAIISVGDNNSYGHPTQEVLDRLAACDCQILQTNIVGSICLGIDKDGNLLMGGKNNQIPLSLTIIIVVTSFGILLVWGIKTKSVKNRQNSTNKKPPAKKD